MLIYVEIAHIDTNISLADVKFNVPGKIDVVECRMLIFDCLIQVIFAILYKTYFKKPHAVI